MVIRRFLTAALPTFETLRTNALSRDVYWSTPAVAGGNVFIRSVDALVCVK